MILKKMKFVKPLLFSALLLLTFTISNSFGTSWVDQQLNSNTGGDITASYTISKVVMKDLGNFQIHIYITTTDGNGFYYSYFYNNQNAIWKANQFLSMVLSAKSNSQAVQFYRPNPTTDGSNVNGIITN